MKLLGIIPARGGSKGIQYKNMQLLKGKPLVLHAVDTAIASNIFDRIIVSSDNDAILNCVRTREQIDIPYKRPAHLANDTSLISDVILHLLHYLKQTENYIPDAFMLLEPTCPLRTVTDVNKAFFAFQQENKPCLISVSKPEQHPSNMIYQSQNTWRYCLARQENSRGRQDFQPVWFINGAVYLTRTEFFLKTKLIYDLKSCAIFEIPHERAIDINTPLDLAFAHAQLSLSTSILTHTLSEETSCIN